ncbi:MAG TPA: Hpt domain-containing protein [Solirubrobacterales bacterium]|nr:Hpt domain-containing protein [Solirubrobacterales bacterium]
MYPAFAEVWARNLPSISERVGTIERAAMAAEDGELDGELAARAHSAAHKLSGSLGSFGLAHGSKLARELERRFEAGQGNVDVAGLADLAAALRAEIQR